MGRPKQLVEWEGETLLHRAVRTAVGCQCGPVLTVLGFRAEEMRAELEGLDTRAVVCRQWKLGMGRSLACGIETLLQIVPGVEAAVVMTCDQPELTADVLRGLAEKWKEGCRVAACLYGDTTGVPALFDASCFPELLRLREDRGAKMILLKYEDQLGRVPFPGGSEDIDRPEDLADEDGATA